MALGDMPAKEWVAKEKAGQLPGGEYVVSEILDERWNAEDECREFIVKWKVGARGAQPELAFAKQWFAEKPNPPIASFPYVASGSSSGATIRSHFVRALHELQYPPGLASHWTLYRHW